ncbi:hypothetical protein CONLIGDRAFT_362995 [Coniochaeta ligniaria NRRL 30616]|uniref:Secreted protein n=1 Tax=Coniochaeta ligniaria NRRL 30616 TaxID=1408157 RepID=A0A1J7IRL0_9PEZI|nr:hypothetical protein CONLIGDRAFT_362995 [Coniochaeta ligniaria NRRL 30616]
MAIDMLQCHHQMMFVFRMPACLLLLPTVAFCARPPRQYAHYNVGPAPSWGIRWLRSAAPFPQRSCRLNTPPMTSFRGRTDLCLGGMVGGVDDTRLHSESHPTQVAWYPQLPTVFIPCSKVNRKGKLLSTLINLFVVTV